MKKCWWIIAPKLNLLIHKRHKIRDNDSNYIPSLCHPREGGDPGFTERINIYCEGKGKNMWFKQLQLFEFTETFDLSAEAMEPMLASQQFEDCNAHSANSMGWVAPSGISGAPLVHAANGMLCFCLQIEDKLLPASVVNDEFKRRLELFEQQQHRKMRKQEKMELKEDIYHAFLPRAFSKYSQIHAYIDVTKGWLILNTSSNKKAEQLLASLRQSLGSLKVQLPALQSVPLLLTNWLLKHDYPEAFSIANTCVLSDSQDEGSIRCQKQDLMSEDIQTLLAGREVSQLAITWHDQLQFVLTEHFQIKSINYLDVIQEQMQDIRAETAAEQFDADFVMMTLTFRDLLDDLMGVFKSAQKTEVDVEAAIAEAV